MFSELCCHLYSAEEIEDMKRFYTVMWPLLAKPRPDRSSSWYVSSLFAPALRRPPEGNMGTNLRCQAQSLIQNVPQKFIGII